MVARQILVPESLSTVVAHQRLGLAALQGGNLSLGVVLVFFLVGLFGSIGGLDVIEGLVLVVLEPLKGALDWNRASAGLMTNSNGRATYGPRSS